MSIGQESPHEVSHFMTIPRLAMLQSPPTIDLDVCVSEAGDRQLCTFGCLQNRAPMELLLPLH